MNPEHAENIEGTPSGRRPGHSLALLASILLMVDCAILVVTGANLVRLVQEGAFSPLALTKGGLPVVLYFSWALGIFGSIAALIAIVFYGFRERWFWRCLIVTGVCWLVFPPILTVIGIFSLLLLVRYREDFSPHPRTSPPP